jgi:hypothetical protein
MATLAAIYKISADISGLQASVSKGVDAMEGLEKNTSKITTSLGTMGKALVGAFSVTAVISAGKALVDFAFEAAEAAGAVLDMSAKTGLSTDTIQRMGFVAKQVGSDVEAFTRAAFMLGVNVEKGKGQIDGLGLSFEQLKMMRPDEQFTAVIKALEDMEDPQERNRIAVQLFGKAAQEILPAIAQGYSDIAEQASVSERAQLEALDKASDAWDAFVSNTKTKITSTLGSAVMAVQAFGDASWAQRAKLFGLQAAGQLTADTIKDMFPPEVEATFKSAGHEISDVSNTLTDLGGVVIPPTKAQLRDLSDVTRKHAQATRDLARAAEDLAERGLKLQREEQKRLMQIEMQRFPILHAFIVEHRQDLMLIPPLMRDWVEANKQTTAALLAMVDAGMTTKAYTQEQAREFTTVTEKTVTWRESLGELAGSMTNLAQTSGNTLVSALASMTNAIDVGAKAISNLRTGFVLHLRPRQGPGHGRGLRGVLRRIRQTACAAEPARGRGRAAVDSLDPGRGPEQQGSGGGGHRGSAAGAREDSPDGQSDPARDRH